MKKYLVVYEKIKTGYSAYAPDLPGVIATGRQKSLSKKTFLKPFNFIWMD